MNENGLYLGELFLRYIMRQGHFKGNGDRKINWVGPDWKAWGGSSSGEPEYKFMVNYSPKFGNPVYILQYNNSLFCLRFGAISSINSWWTKAHFYLPSLAIAIAHWTGGAKKIPPDYFWTFDRGIGQQFWQKILEWAGRPSTNPVSEFLSYSWGGSYRGVKNWPKNVEFRCTL